MCYGGFWPSCMVELCSYSSKHVSEKPLQLSVHHGEAFIEKDLHQLLSDAQLLDNALTSSRHCTLIPVLGKCPNRLSGALL